MKNVNQLKITTLLIALEVSIFELSNPFYYYTTEVFSLRWPGVLWLQLP